MITAQTVKALKKQRAIIDGLVSAHDVDLTVAWVRAWDEIAADLDAAITKMMADAVDGAPGVSSVARARQARQALGIASRKIRELAQWAGVELSDEAEQMIRLALIDSAAVVATQLPAVMAGALRSPDERQIAAMVERTTQQITARAYALSEHATEQMKRELMRSIAVGDNPRRAATRMLNRVEGRFNGGLNRALVIARTELLDAYRNAAAAGHVANSDVLKGWQWVSQLSHRTCRSCVAMHGSMHTLDEPGPLDHHQGRCTRVPVTKSYRELGIDAPEPVSALPDAERWFAGLGEAEQRRILTDAGFDAWKAGKYPMSDWARKTRNPDWRDSVHPSRPPLARSLEDAS